MQDTEQKNLEKDARDMTVHDFDIRMSDHARTHVEFNQQVRVETQGTPLMINRRDRDETRQMRLTVESGSMLCNSDNAHNHPLNFSVVATHTVPWHTVGTHTRNGSAMAAH